MATGRELLSKYPTASHVWRRWASPSEEVIDDPAGYLTIYAYLKDHKFAISDPDPDEGGARLVYDLSDYEDIPGGYGPGVRFDPDFFIMGKAEDAKREAGFSSEQINRGARA